MDEHLDKRGRRRRVMHVLAHYRMKFIFIAAD